MRTVVVVYESHERVVDVLDGGGLIRLASRSKYVVVQGEPSLVLLPVLLPDLVIQLLFCTTSRASRMCPFQDFGEAQRVDSVNQRLECVSYLL